MKEAPILFSGPMVRAILEGRKTQTRRVIKPQPCPEPARFEIYSSKRGTWYPCSNSGKTGIGNWAETPCPYQPGDHLWVRETWADTSSESKRCPVSYRATWPLDEEEGRGFDWKPSIFMPRWASRITLEVTEVRVQRLQDITEEDAVAEGCDGLDPETYSEFSAVDEYRGIWNSINDKRGFGWDSNPWVWAITFKRIQ